MNRREFLALLAGVTAFPVNAAVSINVSKTFTWSKHNGVPVLGYHDINNDPDDHYSITPDQFQEQIEWLSDSGYDGLHLKDIDKAKENSIIITFDDGYHSYLDYAYPYLKELGFPATINVVGRWVGTTIPDIKERKALNWDEIRMLHEEGVTSFGCHTHNLHSFKQRGVTQASKDELLTDFWIFQEEFFNKVGTEVDTIAWPFGLYNDLAIEAAKKLGIKYFLTSHSGYYDGNKDRIPRLFITKDNSPETLLKG